MDYKNIVVLTGAGISAESGIKTFRDNNGLWENQRVEDVATPEGYDKDPALVYRFYNQRRQQLLEPNLKPNPAHIALAKLEKQFSGDFLLVTQNVDNLHERAGSQNLLHMHGDLLSARCCATQKTFACTDNFDHTTRCKCCIPASRIRPNIVWFGEMPFYMEEIYQRLWQTDLFISIGTSGNVYPAAGFVEEANRNGAHTVELNLEPSNGGNQFEQKIYGKASQIVPDFVDQLLAQQC